MGMSLSKAMLTKEFCFFFFRSLHLILPMSGGLARTTSMQSNLHRHHHSIATLA
jgi:hypothetical protein